MSQESSFNLKLPIDSVLPEIRTLFKNFGNILIQATPGSGKTTRVPYALLEADRKLKIAVLEPRRLAAKIAAQRICAEHKLTLGDVVGYHVKDENKSSPNSQIVFYTEALLAKKFFSDPLLNDFDGIIFDEFHERHLYTDFCLAQCIRTNEIRKKLGLSPRPLLLMSATSDAAKISELVHSLHIVEVKQKIHPLEILFANESIDPKRFLETTKNILTKIFQNIPEDGNVLFFLPGKFELDRMEEFLENYFIQNKFQFEICKLHGSLTLTQQTKVFEQNSVSRKFILSTNIAESSVTIPGVRTVIDSGFARISGFNPFSGAKMLSLKKISQASCTQRAGRAARESSGLCIRLFSESDFLARNKHETPEIHRSSISQLILENAKIENRLQDCLQKTSLAFIPPIEPSFLNLPWLDIPNQDIYRHSKLELEYLDNIDQDGKLTKLGLKIVDKSLPPRLATLCELAKGSEFEEIASWLSCILEGENFKFADFSPSIEKTFQLFKRTFQTKSLDSWFVKFKNTWNEIHSKFYHNDLNLNKFMSSDLEKFSFVLWQAFPDKLAKQISSTNKEHLQQIEYQMCTGGACTLRESPSHVSPIWILALDGLKHDSKFSSDQKWNLNFYSEIPDTLVELLEISDSKLLQIRTTVDWNETKVKIIENKQVYYGTLNLASSSKDLDSPTEESTNFLVKYLSSQQSSLNKIFNDGELSWKNFACRINIAKSLGLINLKILFDPDKSETFTPQTTPDALRSFFVKSICSKVLKLKSFEELGFEFFARDFLGQENYDILETNLPRFWKPTSQSRKSFVISYSEDGVGTVSAKIQDFFGLNSNPSLAQGRVKLRLEFLGPHGRPLQISSDLKSFWSNGYPQLRKELMRRYPKHPWPEDPSAQKSN